MSSIPPSSRLPLTLEIQNIEAENPKTPPSDAEADMKVAALNKLSPEALWGLKACEINNLPPSSLEKMNARVLNNLSPEASVDISACALNNLVLQESKKIHARVYNMLSQAALGKLSAEKLMLIPPSEQKIINTFVLNHLSAAEIGNLGEAIFNNLPSEAAQELSAHVVNNLAPSVILSVKPGFFNNLSPESLKELNARALNRLLHADTLKASFLNELTSDTIENLRVPFINKLPNAEISKISAFTLINFSRDVRDILKANKFLTLAPEARWTIHASLRLGDYPENYKQCISIFDSISNKIISELDPPSFDEIPLEALGEIKSSIFKNLSIEEKNELNKATALESISPPIAAKLKTSFMEKLMPHRAEKSYSIFLNNISPAAGRYVSAKSINKLEPAEIRKLESSVLDNLAPESQISLNPKVMQNLSNKALWEISASTIKNYSINWIHTDLDKINFLAPESLKILGFLEDYKLEPDLFNIISRHTLMGLPVDLIVFIYRNSRRNEIKDRILNTVGNQPGKLLSYNTQNDEFTPPSPTTESYSYIVANLSDDILFTHGENMLTTVSDEGAIHVLRRFSQKKYNQINEIGENANLDNSIQRIVNTILHSRTDQLAFQQAVEKACEHAKDLLRRRAH